MLTPWCFSENTLIALEIQSSSTSTKPLWSRNLPEWHNNPPMWTSYSAVIVFLTVSCFPEHSTQILAQKTAAFVRGDPQERQKMWVSLSFSWRLLLRQNHLFRCYRLANNLIIKPRINPEVKSSLKLSIFIFCMCCMYVRTHAHAHARKYVCMHVCMFH